MGSAPARPNGRRGSSQSDKQIAHAVKNWNQVAFRPFPDFPVIKGWVTGADDYHWVVLDGQGQTVLIHKTCGLVTITATTLDDSQFDDQVREQIRSAVTPYRNYVMATFFGHEQRSQAS